MASLSADVFWGMVRRDQAPNLSAEENPFLKKMSKIAVENVVLLVLSGLNSDESNLV